jgi:voltage-gated potassium channel
MKRDSLRSAFISIGLLFGIIAVGTTGYALIESMSFTEAFYMTIITIATVGFREVQPLSPAGMYFTAFLIIFSFGIFGFAVTTLIRYVVDGTFRNLYKNTRVKRSIQRLNNHVVVCGYGRNGRQAVHELIGHGVPVVVIEKAEAIMEKILEQQNLLYIHGDATRDDVLEMCRIDKAKALITALPDDAQNLFVVLTARELNPGLTIISRASDEHSDSKLKRAGAASVIMPDRIGGQRMAKLVVQPDIVEFLEYIMLQSTENVALVEIACDNIADCFNGKTLRELDILNESGANIIGMKRSDKSIIINPLPEVALTGTDKLFALGTRRQIHRLRSLLYGGS